MDYDFILSGNAARTFLNCNASDRRKAIQCFDYLVDNPTQEGDFQERGESGRIYEVKIFENFIVIPFLKRFDGFTCLSKSSSKSKSIAISMRIWIWIMSKYFRPS